MSTAGATSVEVFKTNVPDALQALQVEAQIRQIFTWHQISFDLEDCDKILRIAGSNVSAGVVTDILQRCGFFCERLV